MIFVGGREESGCLKTLLSVQKTQIGFKQFARAFFPQSYLLCNFLFQGTSFLLENSAFREMQTLPSIGFSRDAITKLCAVFKTFRL